MKKEVGRVFKGNSELTLNPFVFMSLSESGSIANFMYFTFDMTVKVQIAGDKTAILTVKLLPPSGGLNDEVPTAVLLGLAGESSEATLTAATPHDRELKTDEECEWSTLQFTLQKDSVIAVRMTIEVTNVKGHVPRQGILPHSFKMMYVPKVE